MYTASQKRRENIAEYLLYMWQVEDLIRANGLDIDRLQAAVVDRCGLPPEQQRELRGWYESLIDMMRREDVERSGHLQLNKNVVIQLDDLHRRLMADPRQAAYQSAFYGVLPLIVELRARQGREKLGEVETCMAALYGLLMLRLGGKPVTEATSAAMARISRFVALLARRFHDDDDQEAAPE